jgi:hypothetical protein
MKYLRPILIHAVLKFVVPALIVFFVYDFTVCTGITFDDPHTPLDMHQVRGDCRVRLIPLDSSRLRLFMPSQPIIRKSTALTSRLHPQLKCRVQRPIHFASN